MIKTKIYTLDTTAKHTDSALVEEHKNVNKNIKKVKEVQKKKVHSWYKNKSISKPLNRRLNHKGKMSLFSTETSLYVLNRIFKSPTLIRKFYWLLIFLFGILGCVFQVTEFLSVYFQYPVTVNIERVYVTEQMFPAVTICNNNPVRREFERCFDNGINKIYCPNSTKDFNASNTDKSVKIPTCYEEWNKETKVTYGYKQMLTSHNYKNRIGYGHQVRDFIQHCWFFGKDCGPQHFKQSVSTVYGNCYTFNQRLNVSDYGPSNGLELNLDVQIYRYITITQSAGVRVQVHNPYTISEVDKKGITVSPGFETAIALNKVMYMRLPPPYKDRCRSYETGDNQQNCLDHCYENITLSYCHCSTLGNLRKDVPNCIMSDPLVACCLRMFDKKNYTCDCPVACEEEKYIMQMSTAVFPARMFYERKKVEYNRLNRSIPFSPYEEFLATKVKLKVYFDSLDFMIYKQEPLYANSELFSQVGGLIGLWLGLTIIFFFECLEKILFGR